MRLRSLLPTLATIGLLAPTTFAQEDQDLRDEIRKIVREEIRAALKDLKGQLAEQMAKAEAKATKAAATKVIELQDKQTREAGAMPEVRWVRLEGGQPTDLPKVVEMRAIDDGEGQHGEHEVLMLRHGDDGEVTLHGAHGGHVVLGEKAGSQAMQIDGDVVVRIGSECCDSQDCCQAGECCTEAAKDAARDKPAKGKAAKDRKNVVRGFQIELDGGRARDLPQDHEAIEVEGFQVEPLDVKVDVKPALKKDRVKAIEVHEVQPSKAHTKKSDAKGTGNKKDKVVVGWSPKAV